MKFTADDKLCCCVPLCHCFGVVLASMNVLTHGCTQVMVEKFDPLEMCIRDRIQEACVLMRENIYDKFTPEDIAESINMSYSLSLIHI